MTSFRRIALVSLMIASTSVMAQMTPGRWEMSSAMKMQGMQMPGAKWSHCFTAKDLAEGKQHKMDDGDAKCAVTDLKTSGAGYSYGFSCTSKEGKMTGKASGTSSASSFTTDIKLRMTPDPGMGEMTQTMTGRRTGDCK
jgi:hypothetical protein